MLRCPGPRSAGTPFRTPFPAGHPLSNDSGESLVGMGGNQVEGAQSVVWGSTSRTVSALVNGVAVTNQGSGLPSVSITAPIGLALLNDPGINGTAGQTSDPR